MKRFAILLFVVGIMLQWSSINAQDCDIFKDFKEGTKTKMVHYDKKDKMTGFTETTVTEKKKLSNGVSISFHQVYDDTEEYTFESGLRIECIDGEVRYDMEKFLDPTTMTAYEGMELDVTSDDLTIPSGSKPGDVLNDGVLKVVVNTGSPVKVTITATISNRQVVSKEKLETPAGKFDCLKISYDILTQVAFIKIKGSTVEYYDSNYGVVRTESYSKKGKLTGYSVLEEISK